MGSPLGPLLANFFMCHIEDILEDSGKLPAYYRRYVDDTLTILPNVNEAKQFLQVLNDIHPALKFTMELETNGVLPFLGIQLINKSPNIETKVYVKPTSTGLLLHYESHVDARYKSSLITTMLQRAWRISSSWKHFTEECERLEVMFCKLKYPHHMVRTNIRRFIDSRATVQQNQQPTKDENSVRLVMPFKDQRSADIVRNRLNDLSRKTPVTIQPVFVSQKINDQLKTRETKPSIVNQQHVVYKFSCDLCDTGHYIGYTMRHLHERVDEHRQKQSSICKHYMLRHGAVPRDLTNNITVLKKCKTKFECLLYEMLYIQKEKPSLNIQSDSLRAKLFL